MQNKPAIMIRVRSHEVSPRNETFCIVFKSANK